MNTRTNSNNAICAGCGFQPSNRSQMIAHAAACGPIVRGAIECCICGTGIIGFGHNPSPVLDDGRCCDNCNTTVVIPVRISQAFKS